jgi:hypothetical protein
MSCICGRCVCQLSKTTLDYIELRVQDYPKIEEKIASRKSQYLQALQRRGNDDINAGIRGKGGGHSDPTANAVLGFYDTPFYEQQNDLKLNIELGFSYLSDIEQRIVKDELWANNYAPDWGYIAKEYLGTTKVKALQARERILRIFGECMGEVTPWIIDDIDERNGENPLRTKQKKRVYAWNERHGMLHTADDVRAFFFGG